MHDHKVSTKLACSIYYWQTLVANQQIEPPKLVKVTVAADDTATVYVDGLQVCETSYLFSTAANFVMKSTSQVVAVSINNFFGFSGFIFYASSGVISDKSWKCSDSEQPITWSQQKFNDSNWPFAHCYAKNGDGAYAALGPIKGIGDNACWISYTRGTAAIATKWYCRKRLISYNI